MADAVREIEPVLLQREEAARFLNLSQRQFDRLSSTIPGVACGKRKKLYDPEDLLAWAAKRKHLGGSSRGSAQKSGKSTSATPANDTVSPRASQILERLRSKPRASTPRLFRVGASAGNGRGDA